MSYKRNTLLIILQQIVLFKWNTVKFGYRSSLAGLWMNSGQYCQILSKKP